MQLTAYCVAICDDTGKPTQFFDGRDYTEDPKKMYIFPESQINNARTEQAGQQRFDQREVKVIKLSLIFNPSNLPPVPVK